MVDYYSGKQVQKAFDKLRQGWDLKTKPSVIFKKVRKSFEDGLDDCICVEIININLNEKRYKCLLIGLFKVLFKNVSKVRFMEEDEEDGSEYAVMERRYMACCFMVDILEAEGL